MMHLIVTVNSLTKIGLFTSNCDFVCSYFTLLPVFYYRQASLKSNFNLHILMMSSNCCCLWFLLKLDAEEECPGKVTVANCSWLYPYL